MTAHDSKPTYAQKYFSDERLQADLQETSSWGVGPRRRAQHLIRLDTPERRARADHEGDIRGNLIPGGRPSDWVQAAVNDLLAMIAAGTEDREMYGERTNREFQESEQARRDAELASLARAYANR